MTSWGSELGEPGECPPAASGAALLNLGGPHRPLSFITGEDARVRAGSEPQDHVLEAEESAGEAAGVLRGGGAPAEAGGQPAAATPPSPPPTPRPGSPKKPTEVLRQTRLAPPRKQAIQQRLADVQRITGAWHQQGH